MRALENIIRLSTEKLSARRRDSQTNEKRFRALAIAILSLGACLVLLWILALGYFLYRASAWLFAS